MTSRNNQVERLANSMPLTQRFALRKLSVGVASVLLGTSIAMGINGEVVHADTATKQSVTAGVPATTTNTVTLPATVADNGDQSTSTTAAAQLQATTPVDGTAYTVTNVNASSEPGNGTDHTGRTNLAFDINVDIAHHDIKNGNYINVSMGIPYKLTANGQQHILAYGGGASQPMPINVNYQTTTGEKKAAVIGYMRPVTASEQSYAVSYHQSPVENVKDVTWQSAENNNSLGSNGNGGSNDYYQIIFNDGLEKIKAQYGDANLSLARMHFNLTWHNITGFDLDEAPLDTRYFHLYSDKATAPTLLVPHNDIQIGNRQFTSGLKIPVAAKATPQDNFNQTIIPESASTYAAHTWYYNLKTQTWSIGDEPLRYPDHEEAVGLASQNDDGVKLGNEFDITVSKPADNDYVDYQFVSDDDVKTALEKSIVSTYQDYYLDPVEGTANTFVTRVMVSTKAPQISVKSTDSAEGLTRTYHVQIAEDYLGFKKDQSIGLITWRPKKLDGVLPPANIKGPNEDPIKTIGYYQGVTLRNAALQKFLEEHPWQLTVTNGHGQDLYNQKAGYYVQPYTYRNDLNTNNGTLSGTINNVENHQVKETIHYVFKSTGKEAAPAYTAKLGFARVNEDGQWQVWTPASDTFAAVTVPEIAGYHAVDNSGTSVKAVDAITVSHDSQDIDVTVYYVADPQLLTYTVIDDDTQQVLKDRVPLAEGLSNEELPATVATAYNKIIDEYLADGYYLVKADKLPAAFDNDAGVDQNVTIYIAKKNHLQDEIHQVTRTIAYYDKDTGKQITLTGLTDPVKQTVKFTRTAVISGKDGSVLGYTRNQKQDKNGNYLVEETDAAKAWQPTTNTWVAVDNPVLAKYGYGAAEDEHGQAYPQVAAVQLTATAGDEAVKVFYPEQVVTSTETAVTTRTINYRYANGPQEGKTAAPSVKQVVTFSRNKKMNQVTSEVTYTDWTSDNNSFAEIKSPVIKYYVPSQEKTAALLAKPGDKDINVTVDYRTVPNAVTYTVIDDTNGKTLVDQQPLASGFADEKLPVSVANSYRDILNHYQQIGYTIVSQDKLPDTFTHEDQNVTIHLLMKNDLRTERQTTTRTITYYDRDTGKQIMLEGITEPVMQQAIFVRQAIIAGPQHQVIGYTLDGKRDHNGNYLIELAAGDADHAWKLAKGGWPASPNPDLSYYGYGPAENEAGENYAVVAAETPTALTPSESIKVYYQARLTPNVEKEAVTRTIHYVYANGPKQGEKAAPDVQQVVTFTRSTETNEVTKQVSFGDWHAVSSTTINNGQEVTASDPAMFAEVISPIIKGYTSAQPTVNSALAVQGQQPIELTVNYTTEPHQITYTVIDDTTGLTLINHYRLGTGYADDKLPAVIATDYDNVSLHYQQLGYQLVSRDQLPSVFADHDLNLVIHLAHGTKNVTDQRFVNEDIKYRFVNGGTAAPTYHAAPIVFTRNGLTDLVTGKTEWQTWIPQSDSFTPVISPIIEGYSTDTLQISTQLVNADSQDLHFIVLYSRKSVIPHPTPEEPDKPVTPVTPVEPVNPGTPDSSATSSSTPAQPSDTPKSDIPATSSSANVPGSSAVPDSNIPVVPDKPTVPTSSATPSSDVPDTPAKPAVPTSETPLDEPSTTPTASAAPASVGTLNSPTSASQPSVVPTNEAVIPVTVHTAASENVANKTGQSSSELPQTGNQHRSICQVIIGAFLGLFGISLGKRGKRRN